MRILFLCSSAEPGRDGVGDYVRLLARALENQGHVCATIALNDPWTGEVIETAFELRLPTSLPWADRVARVAVFRERFRHDWTSLQLVPYGFDPRGLIAHLPWPQLTGTGPLHLMLHEIWIGIALDASWRNRWRGGRQKRQLQRVVGDLKPQLVTTTNAPYLSVLTRAGFHPFPEPLPLFGNVPITLTSADAEWPAAIRHAGITSANRAQFWIGVFFGGLHPEWRAEPFLGRTLAAAGTAGKKLVLVLAGRAGAAGEKIWHELHRDYGDRITLVHLGEQPAPDISALLQEADFGIAASPWQLIGKSGSAATMLDHGLPVIVTRDDFHLPGEFNGPPLDPLLIRADGSLTARLVQGLKRREPRSHAPDLAARLTALLDLAARPNG